VTGAKRAHETRRVEYCRVHSGRILTLIEAAAATCTV
jgi:hypothetical protein